LRRQTVSYAEMEPLQENLFTVKELADKLKLSPDTIRRMFRNEPGTIILPSTLGNRHGKRPFTTLRVPGSVVERVLRRHMQISPAKIL
jgi:Helix-turn-helix domain